MKIFILFLLMTSSFSVVGSKLYFKNMPPGWNVTKIYNSTRQVRRQVGRRLGVPLKDLTNNYLNINGKSIMVNILEAYNEPSAQVLYEKISSMKGHPAFCLRKGETVIEFTGRQATVAIAQKIAWELGFAPKPHKVNYQLEFQLAAVEKSHYMTINRLSNLLASPPSGASPKLGRFLRKFAFGKKIYLRNNPGKSIYTFEPESRSNQVDDGVVAYAFRTLPEKYKVPYVNVQAIIKVDDSGLTKSANIDQETYTAATEFWPADDPAIKALSSKLVSGLKERRQKIKVLLRASYLPRRGPLRGTRYGVKKVLAQQFGNCWDAADLFVTLCRSANIPCRQVAGWFYGLSGHVWAEYWDAGKGWQQVDPSSGGKIKCGIYYIPYFTSDDGRMPILYVAFPKIKVLK